MDIDIIFGFAGNLVSIGVAIEVGCLFSCIIQVVFKCYMGWCNNCHYRGTACHSCERFHVQELYTVDERQG